MSWDSVGRSIERDVTLTVGAIAASLVVVGGVIAIGVEKLWHRHRQG